MSTAMNRAPEVSEVPDVAAVLVVLVTHNGGPWLGDSLQSLAGQSYSPIDVIVVDNGSSSAAEPIVRRALHDAEFLRLTTNVGFGAAANAALEFSQSAPSAAYYLFLHDDVELDQDCISQLIATAKESNAGIVGGKGLDWERSEALVEVGLTTDQLGYAFSGLEEGEIDQGQHDAVREVLFVSSACMLVSRDLVERVGSWDGLYFAFAEDVDLCIRGRIAGFKVMVQPAARFRHALGLVSGGREARGTRSIRFYTRRNRLRLIAKTAAAYRMWAVMLLYLGVTFAEMLTLVALRRFQDLPDYPRAFGSFMLSIPEVIRRRRAVQKRRTIPDRRIRRLMVRDVHRLRVFAERRFREWEVGTLQFGSKTLSRLAPSNLRATLVDWVQTPATLGVLLVLVLLTVAARRSLGGVPIGAGSLWPPPAEGGSLISGFVSGWRDVGLGTSSAAPPNMAVFWVAWLLTLGKPELLQRVLEFGLIAIGLIGLYRFAARRTASPLARLIAFAFYAISPCTQSFVEHADLSAMALYAGVPWIFEIAIRMLGPSPGVDGDRSPTPLTTDALVSDSLRLALLIALVVAVAASGWFVIALGLLVLAIYAGLTAWDRRETATRFRFMLAALPAALILLVPWSLEAFRPSGAALAPATSGLGGGVMWGPLWAELGFRQFLSVAPSGGILASIVAASLVVGALTLSTPSRRRESRQLIAVWLTFGLLGGLASKGWAPTFSNSPQMWLVVPLFCGAVVCGHLVSGLREELQRHVLGWRHALAGLVGLAATAGFVAGWAPSLSGWERPLSTVAAPSSELGRSLSSFFTSEAEETGQFRILWLGTKYLDPIRSGATRAEDAPFFVTSEEGITMLDLFPPPPAEGEEKLEEVVEAVLERRLHHAGHLLAPAGIKYLVVDTKDKATIEAMARQQDIALQHQQSGVAVFRNLQWLPRASLMPTALAKVASAINFDDRELMQANWVGGREVGPRSESSFESALPRTYHPGVHLADNFNPGWRAKVGETELELSKAFGWSNQFEIPVGVEGEIQISYSRRWVRILWLLLETLLIALAISMTRVGTDSGRSR